MSAGSSGAISEAARESKLFLAGMSPRANASPPADRRCLAARTARFEESRAPIAFGELPIAGAGFHEIGEIRLRMGDLDGAEEALRA